MIIQSLLDTDLYKFTMMQVVLHQFPGATVEYRFKCRNPHAAIRPYADQIQTEIDHFCQLQMQDDELDYLRSLPFLKEDFVDFLRIFKPSADYIHMDASGEHFELTIKGPWLHTILFEVPMLAIISEVFFKNECPEPDFSEGERRLQQKIDFLNQAQLGDDFKFSDFGTRRRFSRDWQEQVVATLQQNVGQWVRGTSNVYLAKKYDLTPIGTMAHEYIQACQSLGPRLKYSQQFAFDCWAKEYRGDLGIALSDTYSTAAFLNDFDLYFCKLFDGARQDSGDPFAWAEAIIQHYQKNKIDPKTKTLIFSDSLTFEKAVRLYEQLHDRIKVGFGIGTNLTNDLGVMPNDMVIKMVECNGQPVAKISDEPGKTMCQDASYLKYLREVFNIN